MNQPSSARSLSIHIHLELRVSLESLTYKKPQRRTVEVSENRVERFGAYSPAIATTKISIWRAIDSTYRLSPSLRRVIGTVQVLPFALSNLMWSLLI